MINSNTLKDAFEGSFKSFKGKTAFKYYNKRYSYSDVHKITNQIIHYFQNLGLKHKDKIAVCSRNIPEIGFLNIAALRMGLTLIPLNYLLKYEEVKFILEDSGARFLFLQKTFLDELSGLSDLGSLDGMVLMDEGEGFPVLNDEIKKCSNKDNDINYPVKYNDVAIIIYTSGTTGKPKGVMLSHENILANVKDLIIITKLKHSNSVYTLLPLFHAYSFTTSFVLPFAWGNKLVFLDDLTNGKLIIKTMVKERITHLIAIPTIFNAMSKAKLPKIFKYLNPLKYCISGAAPLPPSTALRFREKFNLDIHEGYGLSECSPVVSANHLYLPPVIGSVGKPLPSNEVKVVNDEEMEVPTGEIGEVIVKGKNVMLGYYNNHGETEKLIKNGWLFTGDFGRFDEDGNLYIIDRKKDLIIKHGLNIYPQEIERILMMEESIKEVAVVGIETTEKDEVPVAFYESVDKKEIPANILKTLCEKHLANYKVPQRFIFMEELPKTPTGKPLKRELKKQKI